MHSYDFVASMISEDYQKVLKNIKKFEDRKKKKRNAEHLNDDDDDDDNESDAEFDRKSRYAVLKGVKNNVITYPVLFRPTGDLENHENLPTLQTRTRLKWRSSLMMNGSMAVMTTMRMNLRWEAQGERCHTWT